MILCSKPSNKRFIIQLEEYKIELSKCACLASPLMMRMRDRLTRVEFSRAFTNVVADWSDIKTCQTNKSINYLKSQLFQTFARKTEME